MALMTISSSLFLDWLRKQIKRFLYVFGMNKLFISFQDRPNVIPIARIFFCSFTHTTN